MLTDPKRTTDFNLASMYCLHDDDAADNSQERAVLVLPHKLPHTLPHMVKPIVQHGQELELKPKPEDERKKEVDGSGGCP